MHIENCKLHESLIINQQTIITILKNNPTRVKLGIQTPQGIEVQRNEVHKRIQKEHAGKKGKRF